MEPLLRGDAPAGSQRTRDLCSYTRGSTPPPGRQGLSGARPALGPCCTWLQKDTNGTDGGGPAVLCSPRVLLGPRAKAAGRGLASAWGGTLSPRSLWQQPPGLHAGLPEVSLSGPGTRSSGKPSMALGEELQVHLWWSDAARAGGQLRTPPDRARTSPPPILPLGWPRPPSHRPRPSS